MFSQTVEYALRAVAYLVDQAPEARTNDQIATVTKVPSAYLSKIMQSLKRSGLVRAQRGIGGGMTLAADPQTITILQVVDAVDPIKRITTCPLGLESHGKRLCPLHKRMDNALAEVEDAFRLTTLAEVLAEPSLSIPLCDSPPAEAADTCNGHHESCSNGVHDLGKELGQ